MQEKQASDFKLISLITNGVLIGGVVGVMLIAYRILVGYFQQLMQGVYAFGRSGGLPMLSVIALVAVLGLIVGGFTQAEPKIGGSGIPQVTGQLKDLMAVNWKTVLPFKFVGGLIGLATGLTVGREGPSVQMGAGVGQAVAETLGYDSAKGKLCLSAGAAAGLSAAFNAPLSGLMFALEELHARFDKAVLVIAAAAVVAADLLVTKLLEFHPEVHLGMLSGDFTLSIYVALIMLGVLIALLAPLFTRGIRLFKRGYDRLPAPTCVKVMLPFIVTGAAILIEPAMFGSGAGYLMLPVGENLPISQLAVIAVCKLLLLLIAFSSGMPGGIFLPMLVLGSLIGNICGQLMVGLGVISQAQVALFAALAMGASFAAIVRSPMTAIILLLELTGGFSHFLAIVSVVIAAYAAAEGIRLIPVYEMLLEMQLERR